MTSFKNIAVALMLMGIFTFVNGGELQFSEQANIIEFSRGESFNTTLEYKPSKPSQSIHIILSSRDTKIVSVQPSEIESSNYTSWTIHLKSSNNVGETIVEAVEAKNDNNTKEGAYLHVRVHKLSFLVLVSDIVGWIYFACWSISFYPQIYENYKRKSVVGLNFDFLSLNIYGFTMYAMFNCGLFFVPQFRDEYKLNNPGSLIPVMFNDVFFSVHAIVVSVFTAFQCFIYERDNQRVSTPARILLLFYVILVAFMGTLGYLQQITWLNFLYYCSYIKLSISIIKYIPQAYMNYQRKSTEGWSIGNILMDFSGGIFSMIQMFIQSFNYDDWDSIFGDITKFGLGLFSVLFDILFIHQHYVLYKRYSSSYSPKMK